MKKLLRQITATVSTLALLAAFVPTTQAAVLTLTVNGSATAGIAASTLVSTVTFTPSALAVSDTIELSYSSNVVDTSLVAGNISAANAATDLTVGAATVDTTKNVISIPVTAITTATSPVTITFAANFTTPAAAAHINISVANRTGATTDDIGSRAIAIASDDQVVVTANVVPFLTLVVDNTAIGFGDINTDGSEDTVTATSAIQAVTNAKTSVTISAWMTNGGLNSAGVGYTIAGVTNDSDTTTDGFTLTTVDGGTAATNTLTTTVTRQDMTAAIAAGSAVTIAAENASATRGSNIDVDVTYNTEIAITGAAITPAASDYTATVSYIATGSF